MDRYPDDLDSWFLEFIKSLTDEEHEENAFLEYKSSLKNTGQKLERYR